MNDTPDTVHPSGQARSLSLSTKLAFGAGDSGAGITATLLVFSFFIFLTSVAGLRPGLAGSVLMVGKIADAINDPVIGILSDRTRSRWGRRHIWMLLGSIPFGLFFFLHWIVPFDGSESFHQWMLFFYYLTISIVYNLAFTAVNLPYTALTAELTADYHERTNLNSFRFFFSIGGSLVALILGVVFEKHIADPHLQYVLLGATCGLLAVLPLYWCVWGTEDPSAGESVLEATEEPLPIGEQLKITFGNRPFLLVMGIYLCSWLAFQLTAATLPYYSLHWMRQESYFTVALIVQSVAIVMLFVWSWVSQKIGRKGVYYIGMGLWIIAQGALFFYPRTADNLLYISCAIAGMGVATAYLIPWSMLTDVTDLDELESGQRREGIFYAFMVLLQKMGLAIGLFIVGNALEYFGFVESAAEQPQSALFAIRFVSSIVPVICLIAGCILTYFYPITQEIHAEILLKLSERKTTNNEQRAMSNEQ